MSRRITTLLLVIFIAAFLISGYFLVTYLLEADREQDTFDDLAAIVEQAQSADLSTDDPDAPVVLEPDPSDTDPADPHAGLTAVVDPGTGETVYVLPEYAELYTINQDLIGWLRIEGTDINHPVMHRPEDVDYYLNRDFYGEYSARGCFYLQEACSLSPHSDNATVYGHNMSDGSMMADLLQYKKQSFWEEHKTVTLNTLTQRREYEIVAVFRTSVGENTGFLYNHFIHAADAVAFNAYVEQCKALAYYDTGVEVQYGDKLITLSTCDRSITNGRHVVVAKLLTQAP